jgi:hypothetical protein
VAQVPSKSRTALVAKAAGGVPLVSGVALVVLAVVDPQLPGPLLIGLGGAAIINGTGHMRGVSPRNLRWTLASLACIVFGTLGHLL